MAIVNPEIYTKRVNEVCDKIANEYADAFAGDASVFANIMFQRWDTVHYRLRAELPSIKRRYYDELTQYVYNRALGIVMYREGA